MKDTTNTPYLITNTPYLIWNIQYRGSKGCLVVKSNKVTIAPNSKRQYILYKPMKNNLSFTSTFRKSVLLHENVTNFLS